MAFLFVPFTLLMMLNYPCFSVFTTGLSTLPRTVNDVSIGFDSLTSTILIFGGDDNIAVAYNRQFVTFDINERVFTDHGQYYLTSEQAIEGYAQNYMQIGSELWMISLSGTYFVKADTETYNVTVPSTTIPTTVHEAACLSGSEEYLFVIGGGGDTAPAMNTVQIYRISDGQWLANVSSLNTKRSTLSCLAFGDKLYAIGGDDDSTFLDSIETLDISNMDIIPSKTWDTNWADPLTSGRKATRAVLYGTDIYVIGGKDNEGNRLADINVIDTITGTVSSGDTLDYATSYASSIIVDNTLYVFAGYSNSDGDLDTYQYSILPTKTPSDTPTLAPSGIPTSPPSNKPSRAPTLLPSIMPTLAPSQIPTKRPSTSSIYAMMQPTAGNDDVPRDRNMNKDRNVIIIVAVIAAIVFFCGVLAYWYAHNVTKVTPHKSPEPTSHKSMIDALSKVPLDLFVTKRDLETSGANDKVWDEIEGKGEVEMGYTHEGGPDVDEKNKETNTGIATKQT
eukprot:330181_1